MFYSPANAGDLNSKSNSLFSLLSLFWRAENENLKITWFRINWLSGENTFSRCEFETVRITRRERFVSSKRSRWRMIYGGWYNIYFWTNSLEPCILVYWFVQKSRNQKVKFIKFFIGVFYSTFLIIFPQITIMGSEFFLGSTFFGSWKGLSQVNFQTSNHLKFLQVGKREGNNQISNTPSDCHQAMAA